MFGLVNTMTKANRLTFSRFSRHFLAQTAEANNFHGKCCEPFCSGADGGTGLGLLLFGGIKKQVISDEKSHEFGSNPLVMMVHSCIRKKNILQVRTRHFSW